MENGKVYRAKMFIDATYEGDLMAKAGVSYIVGREGNATIQRDARRHSGRNTQASVHGAGGSLSEARRPGQRFAAVHPTRRWRHARGG